MAVNRRKNILETPKRRRRKRMLYLRKITVFTILIGLVLTGIISLFRLSYVQINNVIISGNQKIETSVINQKAQELSKGNYYFFFPKTFFLFYPKNKLIQDLQGAYTDIEKVQIKREGLNTQHIFITERSPYALYCLTSCFFADTNGYVYATYDNATTTPHEFVTFNDIRPEYASSSPINTYPLKTEIYKNVQSFASSLLPLNLHLQSVIIGVNNDMTVLTEEGKLIISFRESLADQLDLLKTTLLQKTFKNNDGTIKHFSYIDLRFGNKIFYKMNESETTSTSTQI